jgi:hypothetical protein
MTGHMRARYVPPMVRRLVFLLLGRGRAPCSCQRAPRPAPWPACGARGRVGGTCRPQLRGAQCRCPLRPAKAPSVCAVAPRRNGGSAARLRMRRPPELSLALSARGIVLTGSGRRRIRRGVATWFECHEHDSAQLGFTQVRGTPVVSHLSRTRVASSQRWGVARRHAAMCA